MNASRRVSRRPLPSEFESDYHADLIRRVEGDCVMKVLHGQLYWICELASSLSTEQLDRIHPPYSWTIRQVFEHCTNTERLFGYRIMCLADGTEPDLLSWDENASADSRFGLGNFSNLITELGELRKGNLSLLARLSPKCWDCSGTTSGDRVNVRTVAWLAAGHLQHHLEIVEKRCSVTAKRSGPMIE
ncbi:MAG: DinB family protein [Planctomycetota bacterium]